MSDGVGREFSREMTGDCRDSSPGVYSRYSGAAQASGDELPSMMRCQLRVEPRTLELCGSDSGTCNQAVNESLSSGEVLTSKTREHFTHQEVVNYKRSSVSLLTKLY